MAEMSSAPAQARRNGKAPEPEDEPDNDSGAGSLITRALRAVAEFSEVSARGAGGFGSTG